MATKKSGAGTIGKSGARKPRVQIEYEVDLGGAEKKVELPFVMGVMADLSGKPTEALPPVNERKFLEFDVDNFNDRMKSIKPRVAINVPNVLTGKDNLAVDVSFEKMSDLSPDAVAAKVPEINALLEARKRLDALISFMDGKSKAEDLVAKLLKDPALRSALAASPGASKA